MVAGPLRRLEKRGFKNSRSKMRDDLPDYGVALIFSMGMMNTIFISMPRFKEIFTGMGVKMPIYTEILLDVAGLL